MSKGISSRNSEVIHAGLYYPNNSLKSKLCSIGNKSLYRYCKDNNVPVNKCGKLIVGTSDEQWSHLNKIKTYANDNGIIDLKWLSQQEVKVLESEIKCTHALFSPSTGVIDSYAFMLSLLSDSKKYDAELG